MDEDQAMATTINFNKTTAEGVTKLLRSLLANGYQFATNSKRFGSDTRESTLNPRDSTSGDPLNLSFNGWALLTVVDNYGVWQISESDELTFSGDSVVVNKNGLDTEWTITALKQGSV